MPIQVRLQAYSIQQLYFHRQFTQESNGYVTKLTTLTGSFSYKISFPFVVKKISSWTMNSISGMSLLKVVIVVIGGEFSSFIHVDQSESPWIFSTMKILGPLSDPSTGIPVMN